MINPSARPVHKEGVRLVRLGPGGASLLGPGPAAQTVINETALALWELCDGQTTISEMIDAVAVLFEAPADVIVEDVCRTIEELLDADKLALGTEESLRSDALLRASQEADKAHR